MRYLFLILMVCMVSCAGSQKVRYNDFTATVDLGKVPLSTGPLFVSFIPLEESLFITSNNSLDPGNQQLKINTINNANICCYTNNQETCGKEPQIMYYSHIE